ncbi:molybdenum cofactor cytidylyltransferase [Chloroflexota bacterium]
MVSAILLAAGQSKRMGESKQLVRLGQSTIVEQAIDNLLSSAADEVIVVLGYKAKEVMKLIAARPVKLALNPDYRQGMSTSIIAGLNLIDNRTQAVMLALGDEPFIDSQTINRLIAGFYNHEKGIVIPVNRGRPGHPVIFDIKYKGELLRLKGDIGGREIIDRHTDDILELAVECEGIYLDIDTVDSYHLEGNKPQIKIPGRNTA